MCSGVLITLLFGPPYNSATASAYGASKLVRYNVPVIMFQRRTTERTHGRRTIDLFNDTGCTISLVNRNPVARRTFAFTSFDSYGLEMGQLDGHLHYLDDPIRYIYIYIYIYRYIEKSRTQIWIHSHFGPSLLVCTVVTHDHDNARYPDVACACVVAMYGGVQQCG